MEERFEQACKDGTIPGVVLFAQSMSGEYMIDFAFTKPTFYLMISSIFDEGYTAKFRYCRAFGSRSVKDEHSRPPLEPCTLMRTASASKLITSVAAMQCVERKLIGLDDDVTAVVPELQDIKLLTGYDENEKPILITPKEKITLRFALPFPHSPPRCLS